MNTYEEAFVAFSADMQKMGLHFHEDSYRAVIDYLGPSVFSKDASLVACSDKNEIEYIKKNFLVGKLGLDENDPRLDQALHEVCQALGESNKRKHRPTFYYLLMAVLEQDFDKLA